MSSRLPAQERKAAVLDCACGIFSTGSYRGTTTAEIARKAGVTEPILYRHFESKRDLYLAVLEESWRLLRELWDEVVAEEEDPKLWVLAIGTAYFEATDPRLHTANLWIQSLTEASDDPEIRKYLRKHMREVHRYVADLMRRAQEAGGVRGPRSERRGVDLPGHRPARNSRPPRRRPGRRGLPPDLQFPSPVDDRRSRPAGPKVPARKRRGAARRGALKGEAPAAAPGTSDLAAESHLFGASPRFRGDDPEAFGSAAQPTPPGPYVANLWRAPCSVRPGVWRSCKVKLTIEPVFNGVK